jgi:gliding motility-associated-like protein
MKSLNTYGIALALSSSLFFSCATREENESSIIDDPDFQPQTEEMLINDSTDLNLNSCYFENNDLKIIYSGIGSDSLHWLRKNAMDEFVIFSHDKYIKIAQVGNFKLKVYKSQDTNTLSINISVCASAIDAVPPSFTPNNDGKFDTWAPIGKGVKKISFSITSMDNEKLFESTSLDTAWDGTFNDKPVPSGSYRYKVSGTLINGKAFTYTGILSLSR